MSKPFLVFLFLFSSSSGTEFGSSTPSSELLSVCADFEATFAKCWLEKLRCNVLYDKQLMFFHVLPYELHLAECFV